MSILVMGDASDVIGYDRRTPEPAVHLMHNSI